ncbi:TPA: hypothetical protein ACU9T0_006122 [Burkholderia cenocepacia]
MNNTLHYATITARAEHEMVEYLAIAAVTHAADDPSRAASAWRAALAIELESARRGVLRTRCAHLFG